MLSLAFTTGLFSTGCPRRATVAPPLGPPQNSVFGPPGVVRTPDFRRQRPVVPDRNLSVNPWKPTVKEREWTSIVIHHTATSRGSVESIHAAHLKRKDGNGRPWKGIGYHFVIGNGNGMEDGEIEETFRWRTQMHGAHSGDREHNDHGIGIALIGNFETTRPSAAQLAAVKRLVATMKREYRIPAKNIVGHKDIKATACPGKYFPLAEVSQAYPDVLLGQQPRTATPASYTRQLTP